MWHTYLIRKHYVSIICEELDFKTFKFVIDVHIKLHNIIA